MLAVAGLVAGLVFVHSRDVITYLTYLPSRLTLGLITVLTPVAGGRSGQPRQPALVHGVPDALAAAGDAQIDRRYVADGGPAIHGDRTERYRPHRTGRTPPPSQPWAILESAGTSFRIYPWRVLGLPWLHPNMCPPSTSPAGRAPQVEHEELRGHDQENASTTAVSAQGSYVEDTHRARKRIGIKPTSA